jgi:hypothetical protein
MSKTIKILFSSFLVIGVLSASFVSAAGIVPCGQKEDDASTTVDESAPCTLCHFFFLITNMVNFVLFKLAGPLALLMLIIGGAMFMLAAGKPETITRARKLIGAVLIGVVIIYSSYFLIGLFLQTIGLAQWTEDIYRSWWEQGFFSINCEVPKTP